MSTFNRKNRFVSKATSGLEAHKNWLEEIAYPAIAEYFAVCTPNLRVYFIPEKVNKMYEKIALTPVETPERRFQLMRSYIHNLTEMHGILLLYSDKKGEPSKAYIMACNKSTKYNLTLFTGSKCCEIEKRLSGATSNVTKPGENEYPVVDLKNVFESYARRLANAKRMS